MRFARLSVVALVMAGFAITGLALAEDKGAPPDGGKLLREVQLLQRLTLLNLTDDQLNQLVQVYAQAGPLEPSTAYNDATVAQLGALRRRLLSGQPLTAEDQTVLAGIIKVSAGGKDRAQQTRWVVEQVQQILTPEQAALLNAPVQPVVAGPAQQQALAHQAIARLQVAIAVPDDQWPVTRAAAIEGLTTNIAPKDRQATGKTLEPFLDRLRELGPEQVKTKADSLSEELSALLPQGVPQVVDAPPAAAQGRGGRRGAGGQGGALRGQLRAFVIFISPEMPGLLAEMKQARGK